jgi:Leucine-rich repeat (LRR) protein
MNLNNLSMLGINDNHLTASDSDLIAWLDSYNPGWDTTQTPCPEGTNCAAVTEIPAAECEILIELYNSTDGENWWDNTDWNVTNTPCSWYGMTCDGGHVTSIVLDVNQLSGSIPASLGNLSNLEVLVLNYNQLSGSIPASLGNLSNLKFLVMESNQLSGSIPAELGNLSNLEYLWLGSNQLCGEIPLSLKNLSHMESLTLEHNHLTASDSDLITWLDSYNPGWDTTQTPCPDPNQNCWAIYENESLHIPCVKVKIFEMELKFEVDMQYQALSNPMTFQLSGAKEATTQISTSDCWAIYENESLHIPCVKVKIFEVELKFEVDMQYQALSNPMTFQLTGAKEK